MLTINREDGSVTAGFTPEEQDAIWRAIVQNMATKILTDLMKETEAATENRTSAHIMGAI